MAKKAAQSVTSLGATKPAGGRKPIPYNTRALLWARAAGRCQYTGCNRSLIGDLLSGSPNANLAAIAHIVADSERGPRGDKILSPKLAVAVENLMMVCDVHHRIIDSHDRVADHPASRLMEMKRLHEERVEIVTGVAEDHGCHAVRFAARIGDNESPVGKGMIQSSLSPDRYVVAGGWIDLDVVNLDLPDHDPAFWAIHLRNLRRGFTEKVHGRMERGEIKRLTSSPFRRSWNHDPLNEPANLHLWGLHPRTRRDQPTSLIQGPVLLRTMTC